MKPKTLNQAIIQQQEREHLSAASGDQIFRGKRTRSGQQATQTSLAFLYSLMLAWSRYNQPFSRA